MKCESKGTLRGTVFFRKLLVNLRNNKTPQMLFCFVSWLCVLGFSFRLGNSHPGNESRLGYRDDFKEVVEYLSPLWTSARCWLLSESWQEWEKHLLVFLLFCPSVVWSEWKLFLQVKASRDKPICTQYLILYCFQPQIILSSFVKNKKVLITCK